MSSYCLASFSRLARGLETSLFTTELNCRVNYSVFCRCALQPDIVTNEPQNIIQSSKRNPLWFEQTEHKKLHIDQFMVLNVSENLRTEKLREPRFHCAEGHFIPL